VPLWASFFGPNPLSFKISNHNDKLSKALRCYLLFKRFIIIDEKRKKIYKKKNKRGFKKNLTTSHPQEGIFKQRYILKIEERKRKEE